MKKTIFLVMCTLMMMPLSFANETSDGQTQTPGSGASLCREGEGKVPDNSTNETGTNAETTSEAANVQDNE